MRQPILSVSGIALNPRPANSATVSEIR